MHRLRTKRASNYRCKQK